MRRIIGAFAPWPHAACVWRPTRKLRVATEGHSRDYSPIDQSPGGPVSSSLGTVFPIQEHDSMRRVLATGLAALVGLALAAPAVASKVIAPAPIPRRVALAD